MPVEEPPKSTNPWNSDRGGKSTTNADDAKPEAPAKPALRLELSTAFTISSPGPGTQTLDDEWSSFEKAEDGGEGPEARNQKKLREKAKKQAQAEKGEKNSPRPPSAATMNKLDNPIVQESNPVPVVILRATDYA